MGEIINLNSKRDDPHMEGEAICISCKHTWEAVAPVGTHELECPSCGRYAGFFKTLIHVDGGVPRFECGTCHCGIWTVLKTGIQCCGCGKRLGWDAVIDA